MIEADIKYPTESRLMTVAMCRIASRLRRLKGALVEVTSRDRTATARAHQQSISVWRRRFYEAKTKALASTGALVDRAARCQRTTRATI